MIHVALLPLLGLVVALLGLLAASVWALSASRRRARKMAAGMATDIARLAMVAQHTSNAVIITDKDNRVTWVNQGFVRLTGYSAEEAIGRPPGDLMVCDRTDPTTSSDIRAAMMAGRMYTGEMAHRTKDGRLYWTQLELQPLRDDAGQVNGFMAVETDVTAARDAADVIRRQRERLDAILEGNAAGSFEWNVQTGLTQLDQRAAAMLGHPQGELQALHHSTWLDRIHDADLPGWTRQMQRHLAGQTDRFECEVRVRHHDGHWIWLHARCKVAATRADGRAESVSGSFTDITRRKADEAALEEQHERLRNVTAGMPAVVYELELAADNHFRFNFVSDALVDLFGIEPEAAQADANAVFRAVSPDDLPDLMVAMKRSAVTLEPVRMEVRILVNGETKWVSGEARPRSLHNGALVWHGLIADVTRRKRSDDELAHAMAMAEQAVMAKSAFLATMSHEIRTPMNGVLGMAEVLASTSLDEEQLDAVQTIRESGAALLRIIDDILDFSKIEAGRLSIERTPVSISSLIEGACDALGAVASGAEVELDLFVDPALPGQAWTDPTRVRQLIYNLVGNAIKFSAGQARRRGRVSVRADKSAPADGRPAELVLTVSDNGIGMAPETLDSLFQAFTQAEVSTTRRFGGSGLGLAICHRLVEMMQGRIEVASEPGVGSEFSVFLPLEALEAPEPTEPSQQAPERPGQPTLRGVMCVVVSAGSRRAADIRSSLEAVEAQVEMVDDVTEAAARAAAIAGPVVVLHDDDRVATEPTLALAGSRPEDDARHLVLRRGQRGPARMIAPNLAVVDIIRRTALLRAVAMLAGRASPEPDPSTWARTTVLGMLDAPADDAQAEESTAILVAEDDPINRKVIARQLAVLGYTATMADNGEEALRLWREGAYALLLTDLHMPVMDGYVLAQNLRREEAARDRVAGGVPTRMPILALTANALRGETERALAVGMDEYLTKPVQLKALAAALDRWLDTGLAQVPDPRLWTEAPADNASIDDLPVLDLAVLQELFSDTPQLVEEILQTFRDTLLSVTVDFGKAFAQADSMRIAALAHGLKSSSRAIGAMRLGQLCAELERSGSNATWRPGDEASLQALVSEVASAITSALATHRVPA